MQNITMVTEIVGIFSFLVNGISYGDVMVVGNGVILRLIHSEIQRIALILYRTELWGFCGMVD